MIIAFCIPLWEFAQEEETNISSIKAIREDPLKYEGKMVRLSGYVETSHLVGFSLLSEDRKEEIRLVSPDVIGFTFPVHRDKLYKKFWRIRTHLDNNPDRVDIKVELDGFVRVLKKNGQIAEEFSVPDQFPIEVVPVRILKIGPNRKDKNH